MHANTREHDHQTDARRGGDRTPWLCAAPRVDAHGKAVSEGAQTEIGGNDRYVAMCRRHFSEALGT